MTITATSSVIDPPDQGQPSETYAALLLLAERKTGRIPAELLVRHVVAVTAAAEWPVKRAALEALLRRLGVARQEELAVAAAPPGGLGAYTTRRKRSPERPYTTRLDALDPLRGSCDCRDFTRSSLGLCKHLLVALAHALSKRPAKTSIGGAPRQARRPSLTWDPIRPLTGTGDWMERVRLVAPAGGEPPALGGNGLRGRFGHGPDGTLALRAPRPDDVPARFALAEALLGATSRGGPLTAEPALVALLRQERARWAPVVERRLDPDTVKHALRQLKRPLYAYQLEGVRRFLAAGRLLLADDMGLGKTAQAVAAAHVLFQARRVERGLLVVPASLKDQWLREWRLFSDAPLALVEGSPDARAATYRRTRRGFLITNYEQVLRDLALIQRWSAELVVLDEAQRIKNWATKTAAYVKALHPTWRLVLTGTPMENRLEELASLLDWVDDMALEPKWRLTPLHAQQADGGREVVGARQLDTLRARLQPCLLRRGRGEVADQLPARTDTLVPVAITESQAAAHAELDLPIATLAARARRRPLTPAEFLRLMSLLTTQRIIANGMAQLEFERTWPALSRLRRPADETLRELASPKLGHLREILGQVAVQQRRKVVVFSQWRRMLTLAHWATRDLLDDGGLRAAFFTGQESGRRRTQNVVDFHDDPALGVLFATDAGGVGLNLQRAASCCINVDLPWNPAVLEQRIGRIYRPGQKHPIDVYNLVTEASIEARIAGVVADKKALFTGLFDGESNEVRFERSTSFMSRLERLIEPARAPEPRADESPEDEHAAESAIDALVSAADESIESSAAEPATEPSPSEPLSPEAQAPRPAPTPPALTSRAPEAADASSALTSDLLAQLTIRRRDDGSLTLDAPPEAADMLATLLEGMARLLRQAAPATKA